MISLLSRSRRAVLWIGATFFLAGATAVPPVQAQQPPIGTPWTKEHATSVRLIGGRGTGGEILAGIEIQLDPEWKTYWRNPGSSGVPPRVEWTGSVNLAKADLLFPAPQRFPDREGDTIGYKTAVVLPVKIVPTDPAKPVTLKLALEYGVCRDVCVPAQATFDLTLPAGAALPQASEALLAALKRVPRADAARLANDPVARSIKIELAGDKPRILIEADFPGNAAGADAFLEAPDGLWMPLAKATGGEGRVRRFEVDLTDGADIADLKGRDIRLTLVSAAGDSETSFPFK